MALIREELALIVCSRNRTEHLEALFEMLARLETLPSRVVVVDSSDVPVFKKPDAFDQRVQVDVLRTAPGLPFQKNAGIIEVLSWKIAPRIVSFIDDDVELQADYFEVVLSLFDRNPEFVAIGGFDSAQGPYPSSRIRKLLGLSSKAGAGKLLRNGIAIPCQPTADLEKVDWLPGFTTNFPIAIVRRYKFDGSVRIYGEEVAYQLQIAHEGPIGCSALLPVVHMQAQESKDNYRDIQGYYDGFRWAMAVKYPDKFSKFKVLWTTFVMLLGELSNWSIRRSELGRLGFLGHLDFIKRLAVGEDVEQRVGHLEWTRQTFS